MKTYRGPDGREHLWFEADEIELIMEDELGKAGLQPTELKPEVDVEKFIERHLKSSLDQHADLEPSVLGLTEFRPGEAPRILINRDLSGTADDLGGISGGAVGRWRATMAHEAAHAVLHRVLFEFDENQGELFERGEGIRERALLRCLKRSVSFAASGGDWREVQANKGMAALLMPRRVFHKVVKGLLADHDQGSEDGSALVLVPKLADLFLVSKQAATIRLSTLGYVAPAGTSSLPV